MHPIVPLAAVTLLLGAGFYGWLLWMWSGRRWWWIAHVLVALPLSAAVNVLVKAPVGRTVERVSGIEPGSTPGLPLWFYAFALMLAPLTEEAIKVAPLLVKRLRVPVATPRGAYITGLALGVGFGLGEAVYLAFAIARSGSYVDVPWFQFTGFLNERVVTMLLHATMVAVMLVIAQRGHWLLGYLAAVAMHASTNVGALLYQLGIVSQMVAGLWLLVVLIAAVLVLQWLWRVTQPPVSAEDSSQTVYFTRDA